MYVLPPYVITAEELHRVHDVIARVAGLVAVGEIAAKFAMSAS